MKSLDIVATSLLISFVSATSKNFITSIMASNIILDYICPAGQSTKLITIENGDEFSYKTQAGSKYEANVNCTVNYKRGDTCKRIGFGCNDLVLKGRGKRCNEGDKMKISYQPKTRKL